MVIGKCTDVFRGIFWFGGGAEGRNCVGGSFLGGICHGGKKNSMKRAQDFLALL